jgi:hypothetical protein
MPAVPLACPPVVDTATLSPAELEHVPSDFLPASSSIQSRCRIMVS